MAEGFTGRRLLAACLGAGVVLSLASCGDGGDNEQPEAKWKPGQIRPETIVSFPQGMMACLTKEALHDAVTHALDGQETKMNEHFASEGGSIGDCIMLDPRESYKVISSEYRLPETPEAGLLEIVGKDVTAASSGAWAMVLNNDMVKVVEEPS